jgi:hypothetical protein
MYETAYKAKDQGPFNKEGDKGHTDIKRRQMSKAKVPSIKNEIKGTIDVE